MARDRGTFNLSANFEPIIQVPLDSRQMVQNYVDLVDPSTWKDGDGLLWLFDGALVVVANDPSAGIYWLKDSANYTDYVSWEKAGTSGSDTSVGIINIGDGSAGVFAGYDSSGNIQLRTISGASGTTVEVVGDQIIIAIDSSYSGQSNYGENVGEGDASIYKQKVGDALQFRELKAGSSQISIDVSGNVIILDVSAGSSPSSDGLDGGVWISDIDPTGSGNVGDKVFSSDGNVLNYCLTDTSALTVSVLALPGHTNYRPVVTINDVSVSLSEGANQPLWVGTYDIEYDFADASITVIHEDGARWSAVIDADTPAVIQTATFVNGYPSGQTELKAGDTFDVSVMTDVSIVSVIVDNFGAATGGTYGVSGTNVGFTVTIADRGDVSTANGLRLRVVKSTGSTSANYLTTSQGSVDGKDKVNLNNIYPGITFNNIYYPVGQQAIKSAEDASVYHTVTNYDTIQYTTNGTGQLSITSPTTYQQYKRVDYLGGTYNISSPNFRVSANRAANDATTVDTTTVWIAATAPTLSVSNPASRLRSGGNDGTSAQSHTIQIISNQNLITDPSVLKDTGGTWLGTNFTGGPTTWSRTLQVHDNDSKGTYNWGAIYGRGLANLVSTTNTGDTQYVLGGFVSRTMTVLPQLQGKDTSINVEVSDYTKLSTTGSGQTLVWSVKSLTTRSTLGDITDYQAFKWSASATFTKPTSIYILDTNALNSSSQASTFAIQEGI